MVRIGGTMEEGIVTSTWGAFAEAIQRHQEYMSNVLKGFVAVVKDMDTVRSYILKWAKEDNEKEVNGDD